MCTTVRIVNVTINSRYTRFKNDETERKARPSLFVCVEIGDAACLRAMVCFTDDLGSWFRGASGVVSLAILPGSRM